MVPGLVHDDPGDGGPGCVPGAVTLTNLHLDLAHLLTSGHFLHQNLIMQLTVIRIGVTFYLEANNIHNMDMS